MSDTEANAPLSHYANFPAETRTTPPIDQLIRNLVPSGRHRDILNLLDNRVTWSAVKHWRKGRRGTPRWVVERFQALIAPALELQPGPGIEAGKYNLPTIRNKHLIYSPNKKGAP